MAVRKRDDNLRVIHEINKRHRDGCGSYPKIILSMMSLAFGRFSATQAE